MIGEGEVDQLASHLTSLASSQHPLHTPVAKWSQHLPLKGRSPSLCPTQRWVSPHRGPCGRNSLDKGQGWCQRPGRAALSRFHCSAPFQISCLTGRTPLTQAHVKSETQNTQNPNLKQPRSKYKIVRKKKKFTGLPEKGSSRVFAAKRIWTCPAEALMGTLSHEYVWDLGPKVSGDRDNV